MAKGGPHFWKLLTWIRFDLQLMMRFDEGIVVWPSPAAMKGLDFGLVQRLMTRFPGKARIKQKSDRNFMRPRDSKSPP